LLGYLLSQLHSDLFLGVAVHEINLTCTLPTAAEKYNFKELEIHGKNFISETLKLCKVNQVQDINQENVTKIGTKDIVQALQLIERLQMFIANQTVHYQKDVIRQQEVIDTQNKVIDKLTKGVTEELSDQLDDFTGKLTLTVNIFNHSLVFNIDIVCKSTLTFLIH
jgi:hypothetical protein